MRVRRIAFSVLLITMTPVIQQAAYAALETTVTLSFEKDDFLFDKVSGYDRVRLIDGSVFSRPGAPVIPVCQIVVAIPSEFEAIDVHVHSLHSEEITGGFHLFPGQPPARLDGSPPPLFVEPDRQIYSSTAAYPGESGRLGAQTDLAGQQMAVVTIYPMQYMPASGRLILHREMRITVQGRFGHVPGESYAKFTDKQRHHYEQVVRGMVVNPEDVFLDPLMRGPSRSLPGGDFDHVIITSSSYAFYFDDLVEWHNKRGLRDTVVTTSWIYSNYAGSDNQERIRNFVIDAHSTWGTIYFLMGGENSTVPFKYRTYSDESTPSDNYYADYDDDWTCEVYVGRISASSSTQFNTAIGKILNYEKNPPISSYPKDILLIGMDLTIPPEYPRTPAEDLKETIDGYIPSGFNVTKVYDSDAGNHKTATIDALNAGQNLVNHADHSNSTVLGLGDLNHNWSLYNSNVDALTNNSQPSNVVSMGCWANDMTYNDGIGEHFVIYNPSQAGVSFTGNTRSGWFFVYNQYNLGQVLAWSKHQFNQNGYPQDICKHCEWTFCLLGDPAMPLWTDTPLDLDVTHPSTLPIGSSPFLVHVESGGSNVSGASVCLWKEGEVYLTGTTSANGDVTFAPSPGITGTMYVTVTKHNYLPYEGDAEVVNEGADPSMTVTYPNGGETLATSVTITWTASDPDPGETALLTIDLDYSSDSGGSWVPIATGEANDGAYDWDISGLSYGSDYLVRATCTDPTERSDSDESDGTFTIDNPGPPTAITDLMASVLGSAIHLSWPEVTEAEDGRPMVVDHYVIYRNDHAAFSPDVADSVGSTADTSYDDPTPALEDPSTNHYYVVKAVDSQGRKSLDSNKVGEFDFGL